MVTGLSVMDNQKFCRVSTSGARGKSATPRLKLCAWVSVLLLFAIALSAPNGARGQSSGPTTSLSDSLDASASRLSVSWMQRWIRRDTSRPGSVLSSLSEDGYLLAKAISAEPSGATGSWEANTESRIVDELNKDSVLGRGQYQVAHCSVDGCIAVIDSRGFEFSELQSLRGRLIERIPDVQYASIQVHCYAAPLNGPHFSFFILSRSVHLRSGGQNEH